VKKRDDEKKEKECKKEKRKSSINRGERTSGVGKRQKEGMG
jgi:hypothetical protein